MVEYYELKCIVPSNEKFAKETLEIKKFPTLRFFAPGAKKSNSIINFDGDIELKDFQKEVSDLVEDDSTPLNEKDLQMFMKKKKSRLFYSIKLEKPSFHLEPSHICLNLQIDLNSSVSEIRAKKCLKISPLIKFRN